MKNRKQAKRRLTAGLLAAIMAGSLGASATIAKTSATVNAAAGEQAPKDYRVIAYVTQWDWPGTDDPMIDDDAVSGVDVSTVTHINYAFGHIVNAQGSNYNNGFTGAVDVPDPDKLRALVKLKEKKSDLKVLLSVGGWGMDGFCPIVNDPQLRKNFVKSCTEIMKQYGLDGIDLDYEYPGTSGDELDKLVCPHAVPEGGADETNGHIDGDAYLELFKDFRNYEEFGWDHLLTIASGVGYDWMCSAPIADYPNYLDFINIMCYDLYGDWEDHSDFNANLYPSATNPLSYDVCCNRLAYRGYPRDIMNIGIPVYGRDRKSTGLGSWLTYDQIADLIDQGLVSKLDPTTKASLATGVVDGREYAITYDALEDVKLKTDWIQDNGFGGGMYWDYSNDYKHDSIVTKAVWDGLNGSGRKIAPSAPSPRYVNTTSYPEWKSYMDLENQPSKVWYNGKVYQKAGDEWSSPEHQGTWGWTPAFAPEYAMDSSHYNLYNKKIPGATLSYQGEWKMVEDHTAESVVARGEAVKLPGTVDKNALQVASATPSMQYARPGATVSWDMNITGGSAPYTVTNQVWFNALKYSTTAGDVDTELRRTGGPYPLAGSGGEGEKKNKIDCTPVSGTSGKNTVSATFNEEGDYLILTQVTDASGKMAAEFSQIAHITNDVIPFIARVTADTSEFVNKKAQTVTWTASAQNAEGTVSYKIDIYKDGVLYSAGIMSSSDTRSLTLQDAGVYTAKVTANDGTSTASAEGGTVVVKQYKPLAITTLKQNGNMIEAAAENGTAPYRYSYYATKDGKVYLSVANSISPSVEFKPVEAGTYQIRVYVTDRKNERAVKTMNITVR